MSTAKALQGKVIRFDHDRGYGFIAPDTGGEDVFFHARELTHGEIPINSGTVVAFKVIEGERGLKAYDVSVLDEAGVAAVAPARPAVAYSASTDADETCEILSANDFRQQITELIIAAAPSVTAAELVQIRSALTDFAAKYGWLD